MRRAVYFLFSVGVVASLILAAAPTAHAVPVTGQWTNAPGFPTTGAGPIAGDSTASPTVGDNTANSAVQEMVDSPLQSAITLASTGDKIVFTGSVALTGTYLSQGGTNLGNPRTQFRFGLFNDATGNANREGWIGYYMSNASGTGTPNGTLARKPSGNTSAYLSTTGQNGLASTSGSFSNFDDNAYTMSLTVERNSLGQLLVSGALTGATNSFTQSLSTTDTTASTSGTYTFNHLGFLLGNNLGTDQGAFANLDVTFTPGPLPGDYNGNGSVDAADYVMWRNGGPLLNQVDNPSTVDGADYTEWRARFGNPSPGSGLGGGAAVPEPAAFVLLVVAGLAIVRLRSKPR